MLQFIFVCIVSFLLSLDTRFVQLSYQPIQVNGYNCDSIPELNKKIMSFVKTKLKKKVGTGECWDLAAEALNFSKAKWDKSYVFGKEINYKNDCVFPGDIIQFENVVIKYAEGNKFYKETLTHHTAIVFQVKSKKEFRVAEQNTSVTGKKVGLSWLGLENILEGKIKIYRPIK